MLPKGEKIRKAISWVNEMKKDFPDKTFLNLANEANMKFDLTPADSEFLIKFFKSVEAGEILADDEA